MKKYIFVIFALGLVITGYFIWGRGSGANYDFVVAKRQDVIQLVSVTGRVEAAERVDLAFEKSGRISAINIGVGDKVSAGETLMNLANEDLAAQLMQAEADFKTQQARLAELRRGTRPEEVQVQEAKVESAKISVDNAKKDVVNKINDSYTKSDDAVRNKIDQFFDNPRGQNPKVNIQVTDSQLERNLNQDRLLAESTLISWKSSLGELGVASELDFYIDEAQKNLEQIRSFLEEMALAVNSLTPTPSLSLTTINTYKSDVSTARTNVNTVITNLVASEDGLRDDKSALTLAEKQLDLEKAGSTPEQILAQEAQVESAKANAENYRAQISKTIIFSPISGVITRQDAKIGEIISANTPLVSIISDGNFEITANIPEADIAKLKIGNTAQITLDAYGQDILFQAKVVKIDPAETIIEGVPTYRVTLYFNEEDWRIKSGMTANIDILTAESKNAITVPQRAVISKDGEKTVKILEGKEIKETKVRAGLKGTDGNIEILEGLSEGDKIITFMEER